MLTAARTERTPTVPPGARPSRGGIRRRGWTFALLRLTASAMVTGYMTLLSWSLLPMLGGWQARVILTGSMAPHILPGDVIVTAPVHGPLRAGQVVLVDDPGHPDRTLVHRVAEVHPDGSIVTRGDANASNDSTPITPEHIHGLGRLRVPMIGRPAVWVREGRTAPLVAAAVLGSAAMGILVLPGASVGAHRRNRLRRRRS